MDEDQLSFSYFYLLLLLLLLLIIIISVISFCYDIKSYVHFCGGKPLQ